MTKIIFSKEGGLRLIAVVLIYALILPDAISFGRSVSHIKTKTDIKPISLALDYYFDSDSIVEESASEVETVLNYETREVDELEKTELNTVVSGGPGQSETTGFSLSSTDGFVDKFTGDFSYSIPLLDIEGYPIVINYNSNVGMNSEASWVGLGWDLNVGSAAREMRGLPDEFNGEQNIVKYVNQKPNITNNGWKNGGYAGVSAKVQIDGVALWPGVNLSLLKGKYENSYMGVGNTFDFGLQASLSVGEEMRFGPTFGKGWSNDDKNGIGRSTSFGVQLLPFHIDDQNLGGFGLTYGRNYHSRAGLTSKSIQLGAQGSYIWENGTGVGGSLSATTVFPYGTITSTPSFRYRNSGSSDFEQYDLSFSLSTGAFKFSVGGIRMNYDSESKLVYSNSANQTIIQPAYGYLHSSKRKYDSRDFHSGYYPVMDFNRTNDSEFSEEMKNLPFSFQTPDIFRVNAMGLSATFRPRRQDFGTYYDPNSSNEMSGQGDNYGAGVEVPIAGTLSYSKSLQDGGGESGKWNHVLQFSDNSEVLDNDAFDEAVFFKQMGELTPEDQSALALVEGTDKVRFDVNPIEANKEIVLTNTLANDNSTLGQVGSTNINSINNDPVIATVFEPLTTEEASVEVGSTFDSYQENDFPPANPNYLQRSTQSREDNHISALKVKSTNGTEYIYGIPAYNISSSNVMFAVDNNPVESLVQYDQGDNSISNTKGRSGLFEKTVIPEYAHSFLLTEMKSSDYIDVTGNGLSIDDIGSYYKFNHTCIYGNGNSQYNWRFPVGQNLAMFNEGLEASTLDNTANYSYGEKEVWYTHSVESKNLIAEFYLEKRDDAYGVTDENGVLNTDSPLRRLSKIVVYNRNERLSNPNSAVPLKTVEFEYDYHLCPNNPSNINYFNGSQDNTLTGKLTLRKIRISSGNSAEGALSSYEFNYSDVNPEFNYNDVDGWGNYKPNDPVKPNTVFPYASQDVSEANGNSKAWKLNQIVNPSGGAIEIEYEADNYLLVQDKRTMVHMDIKRMTNIFELLKILYSGSWNGIENTYLELSKSHDENSFKTLLGGASWPQSEFDDFLKYNVSKSNSNYTNQFGKLDLKHIPNNVLIFKLKKNLATADFATIEEANSKIKDLFFKVNENGNQYMDELLIKAHVKVKSGGNLEELVPLFARISKDYHDPFSHDLPFDDDFVAIGVMPPSSGSSLYEYGYVVLDPLNSIEGDRKETTNKDKGVWLHPIQRTAIDFIRTNLPDIVYGSCNTCTADLSIDKAVVSGENPYVYMADMKGYIPEIITDYSTVRLYVQDGVKFGGNARVSKITYKDNWDVISTEKKGDYFWNYYYPFRASTSGVASYVTPAIVDETDFYHWDSYINVRKKFPDERNFTPTPISGALFPTPVVGYKEVQVNFNGLYDRGYSKSEFYTADFSPTKSDQTLIEKSHIDKYNPVLGNSMDLFGFSQGFVIETNDYHGKPKSVSTYGGKDINGIDIKQSQTTYNYRSLGSTIPMIDRKGNITQEHVGMEYDIHADSRQITNNSTAMTVGVKVRFPVPFPPFFMPIPIFSYQNRDLAFHSQALVKHIHRSVIVESITTEYLGSINSARNELYDYYSGNVLLSSLNDEYNDRLYSMSYPSHWFYPELRDVNGVINKELAVSCSGSSLFPPSGNAKDYYTPGDNLSLSDGASTSQAVVLVVKDGWAVLINPDGTTYNGVDGNVDVTIVQSGRDNRLFETMQSVTTKSEINVSAGTFDFPSNDIISSSVVTYRNKNNIKCVNEGEEPNNLEVLKGSIINPFDYGARGDLVLDGQFAWQSERSNNVANHGTRFDGSYSTFVPFYDLDNSNQWRRINEYLHPGHQYSDHYQNWRKLGEVTRFDEFGKAMESTDQIRVPSAVLYGFNNELTIVPVAQAVNAKKQQIAFDGFEDYNYYANDPLSYDETHFDFKNSLSADVEINYSQKHSGLSSLEIAPLTNATVNKDVSNACNGESSPIVFEGDGDLQSATFQAEECSCTVPFEPTQGDYIVGAWVKVSHSESEETYISPKIQVTIIGGQVFSFYPSGPIIDGWQRIEGEFNIPLGGTQIQVSLVNESESNKVYFDDFRIHPFLAGMTTTVYDPVNLLPVATHDGYNFTTFYNYDENLNLVRVRVETVEGIKTISESEFSGQKKFKN